MGYQVWIEDYEGSWKKRDCDNLDEAKSVILEASKGGKEPILTQSLPFELKLTVQEPKAEIIKAAKEKYAEAVKIPKEVDKSGAEESKPQDDKSTGG